MIKLNQQQTAVLTSAATQPQGFASRPADMKPSLAAKVAGKLVEHGLVRELHSRGEAPVWREDEHGKRFSLRILKAGHALVKALEGQGTTSAPYGQAAGTDQVGSSSSALDAANTRSVGRKSQTKRSLILGLLRREGGASLDELIAATGWLPHTTRAALTGLRKSGFAVERSRSESGSSVYKIALAPAAEAA